VDCNCGTFNDGVITILPPKLAVKQLWKLETVIMRKTPNAVKSRGP